MINPQVGSIELPTDQVFKNLTNAKSFAIDIGLNVSVDNWCEILIDMQHEKLDSNLMRDFQLVSMTADSISLTEKVLGLSYIKFMTLDLKADLQLTQTGGSLAKLAYFTTVPKKRSCVVESTRVTDETCAGGTVYEIGEEEEMREQLHFIKFESKYIETCLDFIQSNLIEAPELMKGKVIKVTGGGAYKYKDLITEKLGVQVDKEDEMECLLKGCNFLLKNIPDEVFMYQRQSSPEYRFQKIHADNIYPYLLVNIGSGVSFIKVESDSKFERIGGTSIGGGTFWGLGSILTKAKNFDELLEIAESGDHRNIDMLVRDIYGGAYSALGLPADLIASSFGKAARSARDRDDPVFKDSDIAKSLLISISNDIGQIAYLSAKLHGLKKIYFGGYFIRGHPMTMHTISFAINYWSKGEIQALFLRHEGYLGAIGAFLKGAEETDAGRYSWGESVLWSENYAGSSGLVSPRGGFIPPNFPRSESATFDMLELDRFSRPLVVCPLLRDPATYRPDTEDLTVNADARSYWLKCFEDATAQFSERAVQSQPSKADAEQRAGKFKKKYLKRLAELRVNPCAYGSLTVRSLLDTREHCLEEFHFVDPYCQQKQQENEQALRLLSSRLSQLDSLNSDDYWMELVTGLLAGNVFDWGAKEVAALLESGQEFGFSHAVSKLQKRPWLFDDFDRWLERLRTGPPHKCAVIFVDNSGVDIILGVIPFARALLKRGTSVILCANSRAVLNDVTYNELTVLAKRVAQLDDEISEALSASRLLVMESGQGSPCLDLRHTDYDLSEKMKEAGVDLVVLEGMGRAIHTNFSAAFSCEALKVAVLKNEWLAKQLGGKMFDAVFKYETPSCVNISSR